MDTNEIKVRLENLVGDIPEIELIVIFEISGTQVVSNSLEKKNAELVIQEGMKLARQSYKFLTKLNKGKLSDLYIMSQTSAIQIMGQSRYGAICILNEEGKAHFALASKRVRELLIGISQDT